MNWLTFVAGAVLSWGVYGAMLHQGQVKLGSPMRALLCVGVAYFLIGVLVPVVVLFCRGRAERLQRAGTTAATVAGALGALGAVCIIFSFRDRRHADLRDAAGLRRRAARQRPLHDVHPPAEGRAEPDALCRLPGHGRRRRHGAVLQAEQLSAGPSSHLCRHVGRNRARQPVPAAAT